MRRLENGDLMGYTSNAVISSPGASHDPEIPTSAVLFKEQGLRMSKQRMASV